jgi:hypothetical protein
VRLFEVLVGRGTEFAGEARDNPSLTRDATTGAITRYTRVHSDWDYYLLHGFHTAPTAPHDNHFANWGTGHSTRTAIIADALTEDALLEARRAAALHDIGKVAIPDAILQAPRALTEVEWAYMRRHTIIGERIIAAAPELRGVGRIVRSSHERWDGKGYPDGLAGEEIPLGARIVAVCDAYDAMITDRAYRRGRSSHEALEELRRCAGKQFDPVVVGAFAAAMANDFSSHECAIARKRPIERALDVIN